MQVQNIVLLVCSPAAFLSKEDQTQPMQGNNIVFQLFNFQQQQDLFYPNPNPFKHNKIDKKCCTNVHTDLGYETTTVSTHV